MILNFFEDKVKSCHMATTEPSIKLRGINFFPQAIGGMLAERPEFTGEFICRAPRDARGRDELTVTVEVRGEADAALEKAYSDLLRR